MLPTSRRRSFRRVASTCGRRICSDARRTRVRNYVKRHPSLARALDDEILPTNIDFAEDALLAGIRDPKSRGHVPFVMFYLRTKGKHRGYSERVEIAANEQKPLPIAFYLPGGAARCAGADTSRKKSRG